MAVCSGPELAETVAAGVEMACRVAAAGISFSADFRRVFHGLESRNFSRSDLVLMNRDLGSPFSSWLLKLEEGEKQNIKMTFLGFIFHFTFVTKTLITFSCIQNSLNNNFVIFLHDPNYKDYYNWFRSQLKQKCVFVLRHFNLTCFRRTDTIMKSS